jgi:cytochrome P450
MFSNHQVFYDMPGTDRFLALPHSTLDTRQLQWSMLTRVFGAEDCDELQSKMFAAMKPLTAAIERMFVNQANSIAAMERANVPKKAASLVSFSVHTEDQQLWERSVNKRLLVPEALGQPGAVEVDFHSLLRDFGACIAIPLLYGEDFLRRCPHLLSNFWTFDNETFPLLMIGIPPWVPLKAVREGVTARGHLIKELTALYRRIDQYQNEKPVDYGADMSDISTVALERNKVYTQHQFSARHRGEMDLSVLWGQNANTQPLVFWFLTYIYSTPGLVEELRKEIAFAVRISIPNPPQITAFDVLVLSRDCPLLRSAMLETFRLSNEPTSIRYVARPVKVEDGGHNHQLKAGTWVSVPHGVIQKDPAIFPDPNKFLPERFLETDAETGHRVARYGRLTPWGLGPGICKGRSFAEKEILTIAAAIVSLWDITPASGAWKIPAMRPGTGVMCPVEDIRVVVRRRVLL